MRYACSILFSLFFSAASAQVFKLDTLRYNGESETRINFVILSDGYLKSQLPEFIEDATDFTRSLLNTRPFNHYENYFNVFAISVPSNEEGAARDPSNLIDNYFGSTFNFAGIDRLLVPTRDDRILEVLADYFPLYNQVVMLVNSPKYGGSGGWVATASTNVSANEIAIHEVGHSFGFLSDEYWAGPQYAGESPNMTRETSRLRVKWAPWIDNQGIGIYPHTGDANWKKPHRDCKMQFLGSPFCVVCKEQFIHRIHFLTSSIEDFSPQSAESVNDNLEFSITTIRPKPYSLDINWQLDEEDLGVSENVLTLDPELLVNDVHKLSVNVMDLTTQNKRKTLYVSTVTWTISTDITSKRSKGFFERTEDEPVLNVEEVISNNLSISIFPNPSSEQLFIEHEGLNNDFVTFKILDINGKEIKVKTLKGGQSGQSILNIRNLNSGVYILQIKNDRINQTIRFIKE